MLLFDSHIHTICSHDGKLTASEQAEASLKRGLDGICITDHFDAFAYNTDYDCSHIKESIEGAKKAEKEYEGKIEVMSGVELGDFLFGKEISVKCLNNFDFDFILCSVHSKSIGKTVIEGFKGFETFAEMSNHEDHIFAKAYFNCVLETICHKEMDFDSLAHLTYPVRYISAVNKREFDISEHIPKIKEIFKILIDEGKALEINTSCMNSGWKHTLPDMDIVKIYYDMGGRLITLGSDAHLTDRLGVGFETVLENLKEIGFTKYYKYKNRNPVPISINILSAEC